MGRKYKNIKVKVNGIQFDSKKEASRYVELKLLQKAGVIKDLTLQPKFLLQEGFRDSIGENHRQIKYIADFKYFDIEKNCTVIEDVKGMKTDVYKLKKKLFLYKYRDLIFREI